MQTEAPKKRRLTTETRLWSRESSAVRLFGLCHFQTVIIRIARARTDVAAGLVPTRGPHLLLRVSRRDGRRLELLVSRAVARRDGRDDARNGLQFVQLLPLRSVQNIQPLLDVLQVLFVLLKETF